MAKRTPQDRIRHLEGRWLTVSFRLIEACDDAELRLFVFLKLHAIAKHDCFPSSVSILKSLGWSKAKLFRVLNRMKDKDRLKITGGQKSGSSNIYDITWYDRENTKGFVHNLMHKVYRNDTGGCIETIQGGVSKRYTNYKEYNDKEYNNKRNRPQKIGDNRRSKTESLSEILKGRKKTLCAR